VSAITPIRVLVVDDNFIARMGITTFLRQQPQIQVVAEADGGLEALKLMSEHAVDVVLADMKMPDFDGVALTERLGSKYPKVKVLVLSHYEGDENIFRALRAGAMGYLTKEARGEEMVAAIIAVARGERYYPSAIASRLADRIVQPRDRRCAVADGAIGGCLCKPRHAEVRRQNTHRGHTCCD